MGDTDKFDSVEQALLFAYSQYRTVYPALAQTQKGSNPTNPNDLDKMERLAFAVVILKNLNDLTTYEKYTIQLHYDIRPEIISIAADWLGTLAVSILDENITTKFAVNACLDWSNHGKMKRDWKWWESCMKKKGVYKGVITKRSNTIKREVLDLYDKKAHNALNILLKQRGIVKENACTSIKSS